MRVTEVRKERDPVTSKNEYHPQQHGNSQDHEPPSSISSPSSSSSSSAAEMMMMMMLTNPSSSSSMLLLSSSSQETKSRPNTSARSNFGGDFCYDDNNEDDKGGEVTENLSSLADGLSEEDDDFFLHSYALHGKSVTANSFLQFMKPPRYNNQKDLDDQGDDDDPTDPTESSSFCEDDDYVDNDDDGFCSEYSQCSFLIRPVDTNESIVEDDDDNAVAAVAMGHPGKEVVRLHPHRVSFGVVHVREYACTVGDHPLCRDECPIALDWKHVDTTDSVGCPLDTYECKRFLVRRHWPQRLDLEQRRDRILETSELDLEHLRELELHAMNVKKRDAELLAFLQQQGGDKEEEEDYDSTDKEIDGGGEGLRSCFSLTTLKDEDILLVSHDNNNLHRHRHRHRPGSHPCSLEIIERKQESTRMPRAVR